MGKESRRQRDRRDRLDREQREREVGEARIEAHKEAGWPVVDLLEQRGLAKVTVELVGHPTLSGVLRGVELEREVEGVIVHVDLTKPVPVEDPEEAA